MYIEALGWFWENRHKLSKLRHKVMLIWLRRMKDFRDIRGVDK